MPTPFPGMDPYLERRGLWEEVHTDLIASIRHFLTPLLRPKYRVAIEQRTYLALLPPGEQLVGIPDVLISGPGRPGGTAGVALAPNAPLIGELPQPEMVRERYLEVRNVATQEVVTVIEILSPTNKIGQEGRAQYEQKRLAVLASLTNLVEIDLLRAGKPFAMKLPGQNGATQSHYRIVVSRSWGRPLADFYLFGLREPLPAFPIPLRRGETEPLLLLQPILHELYDQGGYDLAIDYQQPVEPPLPAEDAAWVKKLLQQQGSIS
jgi:hypothetical protein